MRHTVCKHTDHYLSEKYNKTRMALIREHTSAKKYVLVRNTEIRLVTKDRRHYDTFHRLRLRSGYYASSFLLIAMLFTLNAEPQNTKESEKSCIGFKSIYFVSGPFPAYPSSFLQIV